MPDETLEAYRERVGEHDDFVPPVEPVSFEDRQRALVARMQAEPEIRDYVLAGTYLFLQDFDAGMQQMMKMGGPGGIMKMILGKKMKGDSEDD